jgi:hypothetical protein
MLVLLVILSNSNSVFAKGRGRSTGRQNRQTREILNKNITQNKGQAAGKDSQIDNRKIEREKQRVRADKGKSAENIGKGKEHQQQIRAFERQMLHEKAKYLKRQAQFKRIRELAMKKGNTTVLERLRVLEGKEQGRYVRKHERIMQRMQQIRTGEGGKLLENVQTRTRTRTNTQAQKAKQKLESETKKAEELAEKD